MRDITQCFKAYDIRGTAPEQLNPAFANALGTGVATTFKPAAVVTGRDARLSSPGLEASLTASLRAYGIQTRSLGLCGTEEIYHAAAMGAHDLGIMVTGSHNPINENGFKFVRRGAIPVSSHSGLHELRDATLHNLARPLLHPPLPDIIPQPIRPQYMAWLLKYTGYGDSSSRAKRLKIVVDAGNGCAGPMLEALLPLLPHDFIPMNFTPDGSFPNGVPNPLLPEKRHSVEQAVQNAKADLGIAFDGDFDRCFFFTETGQMVESCYLMGLLAQELLFKFPGQKIVHDARVVWVIRDQIEKAGGIPVMSKGGHSFIKETMRKENALYGGEMSAHHFYRDFAFCDTGMLTMLLVLALLERPGPSLASRVAQAMEEYPISGERNFQVQDTRAVLAKVRGHFHSKAIHEDYLDGLNLEFPDWRFNLRASNTEPLLRLNVESRGNKPLLQEQTERLEELIKSYNS